MRVIGATGYCRIGGGEAMNGFTVQVVMALMYKQPFKLLAYRAVCVLCLCVCACAALGTGQIYPD